MTEPIRSHQDALHRLNDAEYFAWCEQEARKVFEALISKRFPHLVKTKTIRSC